MSAHPIEALLRPPVELWSMFAAFAAAAIAIVAPWSLMMPYAEERPSPASRPGSRALKKGSKIRF